MVLLEVLLMPFQKAPSKELTELVTQVIKKNGRPTKMTPEVVSKLEMAFAWGCSDEEAALFGEISRQTLYLYIKENPAFGDRRDQLKDTPTLMARRAVIRGFENDPMLALKYLERKRKKEFSVKTENTSTVTLVAPILGGLTKGTAERVQAIIDMEAPVKEIVADNSSPDATFDINELMGED